MRQRTVRYLQNIHIISSKTHRIEHVTSLVCVINRCLWLCSITARRVGRAPCGHGSPLSDSSGSGGGLGAAHAVHSAGRPILFRPELPSRRSTFSDAANAVCISSHVDSSWLGTGRHNAVDDLQLIGSFTHSSSLPVTYLFVAPALTHRPALRRRPRQPTREKRAARKYRHFSPYSSPG